MTKIIPYVDTIAFLREKQISYDISSESEESKGAAESIKDTESNAELNSGYVTDEPYFEANNESGEFNEEVSSDELIESSEPNVMKEIISVMR